MVTGNLIFGFRLRAPSKLHSDKQVVYSSQDLDLLVLVC
jgi:hypothetical protein